MKATTTHKAPRNFSVKAATVFLLLALLCYVPLSPARAEDATGAEYPQPWPEFYYYDEPAVLSEATRAGILNQNAALNNSYGVQIVVVAVNSLPAGDYTQRVAYLRGLMQNWQIGGADGRGLLLALSISDEDYLAVAGEKLKDSFTTDSLKSLLDAQLEPDFNAKSYDAGVSRFFSAAAAQAETYCAAHPELFDPSAAQSNPGQSTAGSSKSGKSSAGSSLLLWVAAAAGAVAVICIAIFALAGRGGGRRRSSRHGVHRRSPVITPSRSNVLRYESRPTVHIRSSNRATGVYRNQKTTRSRTNIDRRS